MKSKILMPNRRLIVSVLFVFFCSVSISEEKELILRKFDSTEMANYASQQDFSYMNLTVQPPSIWQRIQWWFANLIARIFSNPNTPWLSEILFYLVLLLVVGVAIFYILKLRYGGALSSDSKHLDGVGSGSIQSMNETDFNQHITNALNAENYKLAIRYIYLKTLSFLSTNEMIKLKDWKSPYDYEKELSRDLAPSYTALTNLFEYVWYGDFEAAKSDFQEGQELSKELEGRVR